MSTATLERRRLTGVDDGARPPRTQTIDPRRVLWIAVPCALAAALVFYELATRSLWLDEGATVSIASQHGGALWSAIAHDGGNMLGYYLLQHVLIGTFGHAPALIRAPSALATVVTVGLVSLLGRRLFDRRVGAAAGLVCAVSLPLVFWGQDARAYALMIMFICGSFLALVSLLEDGASARRRVWAAYAGCLILAVYMSFAAVLVLPAQLLVLLWRRTSGRAVLVALATIAAACAPVAVLAARRGSGQLFWVPSPDAKRIGELLRWLTSAGMPPNVHGSTTSVALLVLTLALLTWITLRIARRPDWRTALLLAWLLVPVVLILAESAAGQPVALARTSLVAVPAVALLLGWGLVNSPVRTLGLAGLALVIALRALQLVPSYGVSPENWRAATGYVLAGAQRGDCVAFYPLDGRMPFAYYVGASGRARSPRTPVAVLPALTWTLTRPYVERYVVPSAAHRARIESACPRLWLIASHEGQRTGPSAVRANDARYEALRVSLARAYPQRSSRTFGWASPVRVQLLTR